MYLVGVFLHSLLLKINSSKRTLMNFDNLIKLLDNSAEIAEYEALREATNDFSTKSNPFTKKKDLDTAKKIKANTSDRKKAILNFGEAGAGTTSDNPYVLNYRDPRSLISYKGEKTPLRTKPDRNHTLNPIIGDRYPDLRELKKVLNKDQTKVAPFKFLSRLTPVVDDINSTVAEIGNSVDDEFQEYMATLAFGPDGKFKDGITREDVVKEADVPKMFSHIRKMFDERLGSKYKDTWVKFAPDDELAHEDPMQFTDLLAYEYLTSFMNMIVGDTQPSKVGGTAFKADADKAIADFGAFNDTSGEDGAVRYDDNGNPIIDEDEEDDSPVKRFGDDDIDAWFANN